ncbi:MAG: hypothetical protein JXX14_04100 [Deltaproteobacteria bacterium]|nr:hypothetical protein [Deltaproteobacteria bacterium]
MRRIILTIWALVMTGCQLFADLDGYSWYSDTDSDTNSTPEYGTGSSDIPVVDSDTDTGFDSDTYQAPQGTDTDSGTALHTDSASGDSDTDSASSSTIDTGSEADSESFSDTGAEAIGDSGIDTASDNRTGSDEDTSIYTEAATECEETNGGTEICDGIDNNCNGSIDEGFDVLSDPANCGGCGNDCMTTPTLWQEFDGEMPANMKTAGCNNGHCEVVDCELGYLDDDVFPYPDCNLYLKQVEVGSAHTCALFSDSTVQCWGNNYFGQLGRETAEDSSSAPGPVMGLSLGAGVTILSIEAASAHTCALLSDSTVQCWGSNAWGQLGRETGNAPGPVEGLSVGSGIVLLSLATGNNHTCALLSNNTVQCWGYNFNGELGRDTGSESFSRTPGPVEGLYLSDGVTISSLEAGGYFTCALLSDHTVQCWGSNSFGQLGRETAGDSSVVPGSVEGISTFLSSLAAGSSHSCALLSHGTVQCWGGNNYGQLGQNPGEVISSSVPVFVSGLSLAAGVAVTSLAAGTFHTCARLSDSTIQCWGDNSYGQLGQVPEEVAYSNTPVALEGFTVGAGVTITAIEAGEHHACALLSDSTVQCWGKNTSGELGRDTGDEMVGAAPAAVENLLY